MVTIKKIVHSLVAGELAVTVMFDCAKQHLLGLTTTLTTDQTQYRSDILNDEVLKRLSAPWPKCDAFMLFLETHEPTATTSEHRADIAFDTLQLTLLRNALYDMTTGASNLTKRLEQLEEKMRELAIRARL